MPLYTKTIKSPTGYKALASESEIYTFLETDLTAIIPDLKVTHEIEYLGRVTKAMYKEDPEAYYQSSIHCRNMPYADVLIKLVECENEVGTAVGAIGYLNEIRNRLSFDMPDYPTAN